MEAKVWKFVVARKNVEAWTSNDHLVSSLILRFVARFPSQSHLLLISFLLLRIHRAWASFWFGSFRMSCFFLFRRLRFNYLIVVGDNIKIQCTMSDNGGLVDRKGWRRKFVVARKSKVGAWTSNHLVSSLILRFVARFPSQSHLLISFLLLRIHPNPIVWIMHSFMRKIWRTLPTPGDESGCKHRGLRELDVCDNACESKMKAGSGGERRRNPKKNWLLPRNVRFQDVV